MLAKHSITMSGIILLVVSTGLLAQTVALNGQLLAEDTNASLPGVAINAISLTKPVSVVQTTTGPDGGFTIMANPGVYYRLCSAATGRYAESCQFSTPVTVQADSGLATVQMTAPTGIRMRIRIIDPGGLLSSTLSLHNPLLIHVFAGNGITRTHIPVQLEQSSSLSNSYEAAVVIPITTNWNVAMSSVLANLFDSGGNFYQPNAPIPRPNDYGDAEFLAVYTLQAK